MYRITTATRKLLKLRKRFRVVAGGTSAGKTISILQILIDMAQSDSTPTLTSVVSESFPHLKRGAMRDFLNIMQAHGYFDDGRWNKTDHTYTFETGSKIEFFSADQPSKVRGPRRDRLFVNEVNNVHRESWEQLTLRTRELVFADWNPVVDFWMYEDYGLNEDTLSADDERCDFLILTYTDNEALDEQIVRDIEERAKRNEQWGRVYAKGLRGEVEGRIYTGWKIIDSIPDTARLVRRGLDFGYSADPASIVDVYEHNGGYILDEQLYRKGMSNKALADVLNSLSGRNVLTVADSAEPKSIDELKLYGVLVVPCQKGPGSVNQRIQYVQAQDISITKRSVNGIKEYRTRMWKFDRDGQQLPVPEPGNDHFLDAAEYALENLKPVGQVKIGEPGWT